MDWLTCASCGLHHSAREDGRCPRCQEPVGANASPYAPPASGLDAPGAMAIAAEVEPETVAEGEATRAQRLAGFVLVAMAALSFVSFLIESRSGQPAMGLFAAVIDLAIGASLIAKKSKYVGLAIVRIVLGMIVWGGLALSSPEQGGPLGAGLVVVSCVGLLLLLVGTARGPRLVAGLVLALLGLGVTALGLVASASPALTAQVFRGGERVTVMQGVGSPWRLALPEGDWLLLPRDEARAQMPLADQWATRPDIDAHAAVIYESLDRGLVVDPDRFADVVASSTPIELRSREKMEGSAGGIRLLEFEGTVAGIHIGMLKALYASPGAAHQVVLWAPIDAFRREREGFRATAQRLELPATK